MLLGPFVGSLKRQRLGARQDQRIARAQIEALIVADVRRRPGNGSGPRNGVGVFRVDFESVDADRQHGPDAQKLHRRRRIENLAEVVARGRCAVKLLAVSERAVHRRGPVQLPISERSRQPVVDSQRPRDGARSRLQHKEGPTGRGPARDRRTEDKARNIRRQDQPALDLGERYVAPSDQRSQPSLNERALLFRNAFHVEAFDKPVDHDETKLSPTLKLLRRHRDANQHIPVCGIGLFDRVGGGEDLGDGDPPASDFGGNGRGFGLEFWKAAFDRHVRDGNGEIRSVLRRRKSRRAGYDDCSRRAGRRRQRARRHARQPGRLRSPRSSKG
jgi:hypothetical protein